MKLCLPNLSLTLEGPDSGWLRRIKNAIEPLRSEYDVIFLAAPNTLGGITSTVVAASDALLIPAPSTPGYFAKSVTYFTELKKLLASLALTHSWEPEFSFVKFVLTDEPSADEVSNFNCRFNYRQAFPGEVLTGEFPAVSSFIGSVEQGTTLYDLSDPGERTRKALDHSIEAADRIVEQVETLLTEHWYPATRKHENSVTTRSEIARALANAGELLARLSHGEMLNDPDELRRQAQAVLRHFPNAREIEQIAESAATRNSLPLLDM